MKKKAQPLSKDITKKVKTGGMDIPSVSLMGGWGMPAAPKSRSESARAKPADLAKMKSPS